MSEKILRVANHTLSQFGECLPILLRMSLLLLFMWYCAEMIDDTVSTVPKLFLVFILALVVLTLLLAIYLSYNRVRADKTNPSAVPLWPFLLLNLLMILLVVMIAKWTPGQGLLGFTQKWAGKIVGL